MKHPITSTIGLALLAGISLVSPAFAVVSMSWTSIGNVNNAADPSTGYGSVDHAYNIGTYEVTNAQYVDFLNAKGASNTYGIFTLDPEHRVLQSYSFPEISGVSEPCKPSHSLRGPDDGGVPPKIRDPQAKEE